jgi:hypothetical protein
MAVEGSGKDDRMGQFRKRKVVNLLARCGLVLGLLISTADAAAPVDSKEAPVTLEGQRKFLNASITLCIERVPALKAEFTDARNHAESQIQRAEAIIGDQVAATASRDRSLLARYIALWRSNADDLLEGLKKQKAEGACPMLRDNWLGLEADVLVEDWQIYLDRNLPEDGTDPPGPGGRT